LTTFDGSEFVNDIFETPITTEGHWKAPRQVGIYSAAINCIHRENWHGGSYRDSCDGCRNGRAPSNLMLQHQSWQEKGTQQQIAYLLIQ